MGKNLFNEEVKEITSKELKTRAQQGKYQKYKSFYNYRPGTKETCCNTCEFCVQKSWGVKIFYKCSKMGGVDKASPASDVQLKMVCDNYSKESVA